MALIGVIDERPRGEVSDGYFPEGSILRRVHSERAVGLFYGQRAFRAVVRGLRGARPLTPRSIREGYNTGHFRMVARTERRRLRRGERTPQVAA